jgi:hypothetical protein
LSSACVEGRIEIDQWNGASFDLGQSLKIVAEDDSVAALGHSFPFALT